ncbi:hypothetical protein FB192DRAFT_1407440 [Mucor lusitanicus]|uniref:Uncharacterized protein n=1 Tax=Mucor circinelloides f. lusitanicus TaxID=29924 RepID=A0A8H4B5Q3_MUCCL|nr:hypothetical protein FB192DRAFT_1407440 [Mucor lusitanicus]
MCSSVVVQVAMAECVFGCALLNVCRSYLATKPEIPKVQTIISNSVIRHHVEIVVSLATVGICFEILHSSQRRCVGHVTCHLKLRMVL